MKIGPKTSSESNTLSGILFGAILAPFWLHVGSILGPISFPKPFRIALGSSRDASRKWLWFRTSFAGSAGGSWRGVDVTWRGAGVAAAFESQRHSGQKCCKYGGGSGGGEKWGPKGGGFSQKNPWPPSGDWSHARPSGPLISYAVRPPLFERARPGGSQYASRKPPRRLTSRHVYWYLRAFAFQC